MTSALCVKTITSAEHSEFIHARPSVSFLQTPAWAAVKSEWRGESIGWFRDGSLVGAGLVLYRKMPKLKRYLAYLPEGPAIDWYSDHLEAWLEPMRAHLSKNGAFGIRMGPPVAGRRWHASTIKAAIADEALITLGDVPADVSEPAVDSIRARLASLGWSEIATEGGFSAGQPKYNFWVPLAGRTEEQLLADMNQLWRRNIKKAIKEGVEVSRGGRDDLRMFHDVYAETAVRDRFTPRPLAYFEKMYDALCAEDPDRMKIYLARHDGDLVAASTMVQVGNHAWYSYGASTTAKREVRGSNAIQWQMMRDALASGATVYDMRGITDTLDPSDSHVGLIQFKVGTGGEAVEYLGEWDLPISKPLYFAFSQYMKRR
ncbi:MAG TPA: peptidoglycan bridge formation glycyltransferase FemA/FemB family protein [Aeromicrobium sp.]|nr:peptidoglycan bridge formation glycyltransferase FemA/FemB family protein [Aeromicrobium sp.]